MMFKAKFLGGIALLLAALHGQAADGPQWEYSGDLGPEHWGDLSPDFTLCKWGVNQSPIDITDTLEAELPPLTLDYTGKAVSILNNGHTLKIGVTPGSNLRVGEEEFELKQFHLHTPSEHRINGEPFLLETHLVHANKQGELAVVAVLHEEGAFNPNFDWLGGVAPVKKGEERPLPAPHKSLAMIDFDTSYFRYNGSLTTPPCTEGVRWYVLKQTTEVSAEQQKNFVKLIGEDARGPQPLNARIVVE